MKFVIVFSLAVFSISTVTRAQTQIRSGAISGAAGSVSAVFTSAPFPGGAVTGAPYSAEQITEHVQTLADGTHITQAPAKTVYYRDSEGRTRIERTFPLPPGAPENAIVRPSLIEINDPVSGAHYTLDERRHTATKFSFPTTLPAPPPNGAAVRPTKLLALAPGPPASTAQATPWFSPAADDQRQKPQMSRESLGTQTIEGILAEGTRITVVHPVGSVGNDRPITTVHETWTSPELKITVLEKDSDPRNGESTIRLTNISRAEPDITLFQVPPDYQIADAEASQNR